MKINVYINLIFLFACMYVEIDPRVYGAVVRKANKPAKAYWLANFVTLKTKDAFCKAFGHVAQTCEIQRLICAGSVEQSNCR